MGNFQGGGSRGGFGGGRSGGKPSFQKKSWGGDRDREVTMHKATCGECGKTCEVPFRPTGEKPVYCNDCFSSMRGSEERAPRRDFDARAPRKEWNDRPAPRADFARPAPAGEDMKKQFVEINAKLDRLINTLERTMNKKEDQLSSFVKVVPMTPVKAAPAAEVKKAPAKTVAKVEVKKAPAVAAKKPAAKAVVAKPAAKKVVAKKAPAKKK